MKFVETKESRERTKTLQYFVWAVRKNGTPARWYSWRVESIAKAQTMVAYWRKAEPSEYPLKAEWIVTRGEHGEEVARFTTAEVV